MRKFYDKSLTVFIWLSPLRQKVKTIWFRQTTFCKPSKGWLDSFIVSKWLHLLENYSATYVVRCVLASKRKYVFSKSLIKIMNNCKSKTCLVPIYACTRESRRTRALKRHGIEIVKMNISKRVEHCSVFPGKPVLINNKFAIWIKCWTRWCESPTSRSLFFKISTVGPKCDAHLRANLLTGRQTDSSIFRHQM